MLKNHLTTALRFLQRNKLFAGINLLGLSLALASSFIVLLYVINELSYNNFYQNRERIFRVVSYQDEPFIDESRTPYVLASTLKDNFSQVEYTSMTKPKGGFKLWLNDEYISVPLTFATNSDFFNIFNVPMSGPLENIFNDPYSIVVSQSLADKLFPDDNPIGQEIAGMVNNSEQMFVVNGVFKDIPQNSSLKADCFISSKWELDRLNAIFYSDDADLNWRRTFWTNWVMLKEGADPDAVENLFKTEDDHLRNFALQNLSDVYLHSEGLATYEGTGDLTSIQLLMAISFLIILVAAINYIILSTAISAGRIKEIGVRKVSGAGIFSLSKQLLSESIFLAFLALPIALSLVQIALPFAEKLFQVRLQIIGSNLLIYLLVYLSLILFIGLVSGLYTSSYLSRINVIHVLNNSIHSGRQKSSMRFALIVMQLIVFCSFMSATLIIRSQINYAMNKDLGYQSNNILFVNIGDNFDYGAFKNTIKSLPNVINAAGASDPLPMMGASWSYIQSFENTDQIKVESMNVDYGFMEMMGMTMVEGRGFSEEFGNDLENSCIFNETAIKQLGIEDPIGKYVVDRSKTIIGVVKDFNLHSIHTEIPPIKIDLTERRHIGQVSIQYVPGSLSTLLPQIENEWQKLAAPGVPFEYMTMEDLMEQYVYAGEKSLGTVVSIVALISLVIAALGLFGLTLFMAKSRTKEIGIKKILGSSEGSIVYSFVRNNLVMVLVAALLSTPITYYFVNNWLQNFAYHIDFTIWPFLFSGLFASMIAVISVSWQAVRAARANPVEALRYE